MVPVQIDSLPNNILIKENSHTTTLTCYWKVTWRIPFGGVLVPEYRSGYIFIMFTTLSSVRSTLR